MRLIRGNVERVAETQEQIDRLKREGYKELSSGLKPKEDPVGKTPEEMTVAELRALAKEHGIEGASGLNKEELLAVVKEVV